MASIVVTPSDWSSEQYRRETLRAARKQAKASRSKVLIKVA